MVLGYYISMSRSIFLILFFLGFVLSITAQFSPKTKGISSFVRFDNTETFFVLSEIEELRNAQIEAVKENWTINTPHFISKDSFLLVSKNVDKSFVYIHQMKVQGTGKKIEVLALVNGGYDKMTTYISNTLAYISIDNEGYESNDIDVVYRLPNLIHQLENIVEITKENNYVERSDVKVRNKMMKDYNDHAGILQHKILLVDRRYLNQKIVSQSEFLKLYRYEIVFVDKETITKAIKEKDSKYAYLVSALNLYKINTVTDCETGNIVYVDFEQEEKLTEDFDRNFSSDDIIKLSAKVKMGK